MVFHPRLVERSGQLFWQKYFGSRFADRLAALRRALRPSSGIAA